MTRKQRKFAGIDLPVFQWHFSAGGKRVVFRQQTVHGDQADHYEMHVVATGALIAKWDPKYGADNYPLPAQRPPVWARTLGNR